MNQHIQATHDKKSEESCDTLSKVGSSISQFGTKIKEYSKDDANPDTMCNKVGEGIEKGGQYLSEFKPADIGKDLTSIIVKYPIPTVLVGMGIGALIGSFVCSSRR